MDPFTPSTPILFLPSWGTALPVITASLVAKDFYNVSLWSLGRYGETCQDAQQRGTLRPVKWNWQWIQSSHWHQWRYSYPGIYCIQMAALNCTQCPTTLSGPFMVQQDTSLGGACCHDGKVRLRATNVQKHRLDPLNKKSVRLRLDLTDENEPRCGTRFYLEFFSNFSGSCTQDSLLETYKTKPDFADELILGHDYGLYEVPVNATSLCARLTPRCDQCAFFCPPTLHHVDLGSPNAPGKPADSVNGDQIFLILGLSWLLLSVLSSVLLLAKLYLPGSGRRYSRPKWLTRYSREGSYPHSSVFSRSKYTVLQVDSNG